METVRARVFSSGIFLFGLGTAGCSAELAAASGTETETQTETEAVTGACTRAHGVVTCPPGAAIPIAALLALEPDFDALGIDEIRGARIAIELFGPIFGHRVELTRYLGGCDENTVGDDVDAILASASVAVLGPSCSGASFVAAPPLSDAGLSLVSPSATSAALTEPDGHAAGFLRTVPGDEVQAQVTATYAHDVLGARRAATLFYADGAYSQAIAAAFAASFAARGGSVVDEEAIDVSDDGPPPDFAAMIQRVVASGADILYLPIFVPDSTEVIQLARAASPGLILVSSDASADQQLFDDVGPAGEGFIYVSQHIELTSLLGRIFKLAFRLRYHEAPGTWAPFAFDSANLILSGIRKVARSHGGTVEIDLAALRRALYATRHLPGLAGPISCTALGECATGGLTVFQLRSGAPVIVGP